MAGRNAGHPVRAVAQALAADSLPAEQAIATALEALLLALRWDAACVWVPVEGEALRRGPAVVRPGGALASLLADAEGSGGLAGAKLPARARRGGVCASARAPRLRPGVGAAFAFPALSAGRLEGVVELVASARLPVGRLRTASAALGVLLGQALARVRLETELAEQGERLQALTDSSVQLRGLVANIPGVVFRCMPEADRPMAYISEDIQEIAGYPASDFLGNCIRSLPSIVHEDDRVRVEEAVQAGVAGRQPFIVEYRLRCADGRIRWVYEKGQPVFDEDGAVRWLDGVLLDITDRKHAEAERERLLAAERAARAEAEAARAQLAAQNEELLHLDRLKDEFVALISHELRTPLTSILGYVDLMLEEDAGSLGREHREFLEIVRRNADRLLNLVGDLLFVAQVDAGKLTLETALVDLGQLAADCVGAMRPRAHDRGVELRFRRRGSTAVEGDPLRLAQLLDNLVSNAIKFTPEGGRVRVSVVGGRGGVELRVRDTGIGISKDEQARLFERFFRAEGATRLAIQGTGLGLTIAKAIAEAHCATIAVESTQGVGTEFRVRFPPAVGAACELAA